jgi:hypothetical protein
MEEIKFPPDFAERTERALTQTKKYGAACIWCGHGYDEYNRERKAEHVAYQCLEAPGKLKEDMRQALLDGHAETPNACAGKKATNKRRCRRKRPCLSGEEEE